MRNHKQKKPSLRLSEYRIISNERPQIICKAFQSCVLNLAADSSDDYKIHCFKKSNPCEKGTKALEFQLQILSEPHKNPSEDIDALDVQNAKMPLQQLCKSMRI